MHEKNFAVLFASILLLSTLLSGCASLGPEDEVPTGDYGPGYSLQEHQVRTLDALWLHLETSYIYYDGGEVDWDSLHQEYQDRIDAGLTADEFGDLLAGLGEDLSDPSVVYQSRAERIQADTGGLAVSGIGAFVSYEDEPAPHFVLLYVFEGSPAARAGLEAHDGIYAIDGEPLTAQEGAAAIARIRGGEGTTVTLGVRTPGEAERTVRVTRAPPSSQAEIQLGIVPGTNYGYLLFPPASYEGMMEEVLLDIQRLATNRELAGLILDLRVSRATAGWPLAEMLTLFHNGVIGEFYNRDNSDMLRIQGQNILDSQNIPLVVLVGENTAGFAEILAAGLQKGRRATIIGAPTSGQIEPISVYYLPDGSHVGLPSASFRLLNGYDIGQNGISPDVLIEAGWDEILTDADPLIEAALDALEAAQ